MNGLQTTIVIVVCLFRTQFKTKKKDFEIIWRQTHLSNMNSEAPSTGENSHPMMNQSDNPDDRNKRKRTASDGGIDSSAVDLMRMMFNKSERKYDDVCGLSEKLLASELKAKHEESIGVLRQKQHEFDVYKTESDKKYDDLKSQLTAEEAAKKELMQRLVTVEGDALKKVDIAYEAQFQSDIDILLAHNAQLNAETDIIISIGGQVQDQNRRPHRPAARV